MPEKLLTVKEASHILEISEQRVKELARKGELPAYKIGGRFLRFRREQIEAVKKEIARAPAGKAREGQKIPEEFPKTGPEAPYSEEPSERLRDFVYFNDFYIVSAAVTLVILWVIFN